MIGTPAEPIESGPTNPPGNNFRQPGNAAPFEQLALPSGDALSEPAEVSEPAVELNDLETLGHFGGPPPRRSWWGLFRPLTNESWMNLPGGAGFLMGGMWGDRLVAGRVDQDSGFMYGFRVGWDFDHYWGLESRFAAADVNLHDPAGIADLDFNNMFLFDGSFLLYPWGETRFRPYFSVGMGLVDVDFTDHLDRGVHSTLLGLPLAIGFKYKFDRRVVLRLDLTDNIAFAGPRDVQTTNNVSLTGGIEVRFGGPRRRNYWPWNPGRNWW